MRSRTSHKLSKLKTCRQRGHVAALIRCVLIGEEYISLIKSCHIRRRNKCVKSEKTLSDRVK